MSNRLKETVLSFDEWSDPIAFHFEIKERLAEHPEELAIAEAIAAEARRSELWESGDLARDCHTALGELRRKFPNVDDKVLACFVKSASSGWN